MATSEVSELLAPSEYRQTRQRIFASDGSFQWYVRKNRPGLIEAGALLMIAGRWQVNAAKFDTYVLSAGTEAARQQLSAT